MRPCNLFVYRELPYLIRMRRSSKASRVDVCLYQEFRPTMWNYSIVAPGMPRKRICTAGG